MKAPKNHVREEERLQDLARYRIIDTEEEKEYDDIASLAAHICGTKISLISMIGRDRQWMKSCFGLGVNEASREHSFCGHAINHSGEFFIIEDAREDERFYDNPFVINDPNVVFYAGVPLYSHNGNPLGTLCVIDDQPNQLTDDQKHALKTLANNVMSLLELRRKNSYIEKVNKRLEKKNEEVIQFADRAAHDIKAPLRSIKNMLEMITKKGELEEEKFNKIMNLAIDSAHNLGYIVDGLLNFAKLDELTSQNKEEIDTENIVQHLHSTIPEDNYELKIDTVVNPISANKPGLYFVLRNLVSNAIKYGDKEKTEVELSIGEDDDELIFSVKDNGPGIPKEHQERIFDPFQTIHNEDRFGQKSTGLGLSAVKKVVDKMGGEIKVESKLGKGATFSFEISK